MHRFIEGKGISPDHIKGYYQALSSPITANFRCLGFCWERVARGLLLFYMKVGGRDVTILSCSFGVRICQLPEKSHDGFDMGDSLLENWLGLLM